MSGAVTINGRFLTRSLSGVERVAAEVVRALIGRHNDRFQFEIQVPRTNDIAGPLEFGTNLGVPVKFGRTKGHVWEQFELPLRTRKRTLLSLCNLGPILKRRQLLNIHDAQVFLVPQSYSANFRRAYQFLLPLLGRRVRRVVTISDYSAKALAEFGVARECIVIPNAANHMDRIDTASDIVPFRDYALAFGSGAAHKNLSLLKDVFEMNADLPLLALAGGGASGIVSGDQTQASDNIVHLGRVSDQQLVGLLQNAKMLLFPSITEGFGMPPLEAMRVGCPVIASTGGAIPEACGNAAILLDPLDKTAWASAIRNLCDNDELRNDLIERGQVQASSWTWNDASDAYADVLFELAGHKNV